MNDEKNYSTDILDNEVILRAAFKPFNVKNEKIKINLFHPPKGLDELSCFRSSIMSISECLKKAKEIENKEKKLYGFALITNNCAVSSSPNLDGSVYVKDSRNHFLGHADLIIGIKIPSKDGEPLSAEDKDKLDTIKSNLYNHSAFILQNNINSPQESDCEDNQLLSNFAHDFLNHINSL